MSVGDVIRGYTLKSEWKLSQRGETARAEKGGKKYFFKKYTDYVLARSDGTFDEKTVEVKKRKFDSYVEIRKEVIELLRPATGPGGNIIIPCDYFVDDIYYYEVTEFIDGAIDDEDLMDFLLSLPNDEKLMLMKTAAAALGTVHSCGVIHSDLKLKNVLIAKSSLGKYVAKIIDFDSSYPENKKKYLGGDEAFASPELMEAVDFDGDDDEYEELLKTLTNKTDIFSLGIIFHKYMTGKSPEPDRLTPFLTNIKATKERTGSPVEFNPSLIISQGCEFVIDSSIKSIKLRALIMDMLDKDPSKRPTALEVLRRLREDEPKIESPWPEHRINFDMAKIGSAKVVGIRQFYDRDRKYEVFYQSGRREILTKDQMISKGYAQSATPPPPVDIFEEPWPEHNVVWNEGKLRAKGYRSLTREIKDGTKAYCLGMLSGIQRHFEIKGLLDLGYATEKNVAPPPPPPPVGTFEDPWPEHNIVLDVENARSQGVDSIKRHTQNGLNGYNVIKIDGSSRFRLPATMVGLGYAKKK